jgi:hypothetical protein
MATKEEAEKFLNSFFEKMRFFDILFRNDRGKNQQALLDLEISPAKRLEIIKSLESDDFVNGPLPDTLNKSTDLWEFGKKVKKKDVYIKITMGFPNSAVICISFHLAERKLNYPFKTNN